MRGDACLGQLATAIRTATMSYRYLGNKSRLKDWITDAIAEKLPLGATVADPMCGTATVSAELAVRGFRVIASDQLKFPVLHAQARLLHNGSTNFGPAGSAYEDYIETLNGLRSVKALFWQEYSDEGTPINGSRPRKYLTGPNAARVDSIRLEIKKWREDGLHSRAADLLLHDLILAINRVANIAGTYGFYRSSWNLDSLNQIRLQPTKIISHRYAHEVYHARADEVLARVAADAVYLDPPYTQRQYAGNYHIPETIAREDDPEPVGEGGLRNWSALASDFCYRRRTSSAFKRILDSTNARWIFISYSEDAHLPSAELIDLLGAYGRVELREKPLERFRSNSKVAREGQVREHLYILEMKNASAVKSG